MSPLSRRTVLQGAGTLLASSALAETALADSPRPAPGARARTPGEELGPIALSLKIGMVGGEASLAEKFLLLKRLGYDGVELDSPNDHALEAVLAARDASGLTIDGTVDSLHWKRGFRLSSADPDARAAGREALETALRDTAAYGGHSVLLVPAVVGGEVSHDQAWERSIGEIRRALPLAAELGVFILIENVWNNFLYDPEGGAEQSAELFARYIDELDSPWVGAQFDIGNHQRYGRPADWIRTLGRRIVKLDVKDWGVESGWAKIGQGDVDWPAVREALAEIRYTGWAAAEVGGGDAERLAEILANMRTHLLGQGEGER